MLVENGIDESKLQQPYGPNSQFAQPQSYTRPVDAVVTSPPYEGTRADGSGINGEMGNAGFHGYTNEKPTAWHTERDQTNIGNLRGEKYWEAMRLVYAECHRVLAPGGVMALVVKGYTRDGQYVDLPQQTVDECEADTGSRDHPGPKRRPVR